MPDITIEQQREALEWADVTLDDLESRDAVLVTDREKARLVLAALVVVVEVKR